MTTVTRLNVGPFPFLKKHGNPDWFSFDRLIIRLFPSLTIYRATYEDTSSGPQLCKLIMRGCDIDIDQLLVSINVQNKKLKTLICKCSKLNIPFTSFLESGRVLSSFWLFVIILIKVSNPPFAGQQRFLSLRSNTGELEALRFCAGSSVQTSHFNYTKPATGSSDSDCRWRSKNCTYIGKMVVIHTKKVI